MSEDHGSVELAFEIEQGDAKRQERLSRDIVKVGTLSSSHLRLDGAGVSRMHAVIEATGPSEVFVIDLGSAAGTFVNGERINKRALVAGDELCFGGVSVRFGGARIREAVAAAPPPPNPFASSLPAPALPPAHQAAPPVFSSEDKATYGVVASGPPVAADEVETAQDALEVMVLWGDSSVLHVEHLSPPRSWAVGDADKHGRPAEGVGYIVGSDVLGVSRLPVVLAEDGAPAAAVVFPDSTGTVTIDGQTRTLDELRADGHLEPCAAVAGAELYRLPRGATLRIQHAGFTFVTRSVPAGRRFVATVADMVLPMAGAAAYTGGVGLLAALMLLIMYFQPPGGSGLNVDNLDTGDRLVQFTLEPDETMFEEVPEYNVGPSAEDGGEGNRHTDTEGMMGDPEEDPSDNGSRIARVDDGEESLALPEQTQQEFVENSTIIGSLAAILGQQPNVPTSVYSRGSANGRDAENYLGNLLGAPGAAWGFNGLGMNGTGRGAGGNADGAVGLGDGRLRTIGRGHGGEQGEGYGDAVQLGDREPAHRTPQFRIDTATSLVGNLSREVIRRVIVRNRNQIRFCYEQALTSEPNLGGRVTTSFIVGASGAVSSAVVTQSTLNSSRVESCVANVVRRMSFPQPEGGGVVTVSYPFVFTTTS